MPAPAPVLPFGSALVAVVGSAEAVGGGTSSLVAAGVAGAVVAAGGGGIWMTTGAGATWGRNAMNAIPPPKPSARTRIGQNQSGTPFFW